MNCNLKVNTQHIINRKWVIQILFLVCDKKVSYKNIKNILSIPNSTLTKRVNELTQIGYLDKFVYGSISKPHYTEYKITQNGLNIINSMLDDTTH